MPFIQIHLKMFFSYTGRKHLKIFHIDFHKINAPNSSCYLSIIFIAIEKHGLCKGYLGKESMEKMDKCPNE
jgi:hypothetical protein